MIDVGHLPRPTYCFEQRRALGTDEFVAVVGYGKMATHGHYGDAFEDVP